MLFTFIEPSFGGLKVLYKYSSHYPNEVGKCDYLSFTDGGNEENKGVTYSHRKLVAEMGRKLKLPDCQYYDWTIKSHIFPSEKLIGMQLGPDSNST